MTTSLHLRSSPSAGRTDDRGAPGRPLLLAAAATGLAATGLGAWLLAHPGSVLGADPAVFLVRAAVGPRTTAGLFAGLGLAGAVGAVAALPRGGTRGGRPALLVLALVQLLGFGVALQSVTTMALAGYLLAMALPLVAAALVVLVVRTYRRLRWMVLGAVAAGVAWGAVSGTLAPAPLARLAGELAAGFVRSAPQTGSTLLTGAAAVVWVLVGVRLLRGTASAQTAGDWVVRHRRALTFVAAAGPLPYVLVRATWLTPWPLVAPEEGMPPELRLWGLLLGAAGLVGVVLTLGLVRPWGEVFPRWFPRLAGRPVPVAAAVVPGGLVAGIVCAAAAPMLWLVLVPAPHSVSTGLTLLERLELALVFPFWIWGPALALAVWGYARHRSVAGGHGHAGG